MPRVDDLVGRALGGRYRLEGTLGSGASATVYLATDAALDRRVAVKVLHAALAADEAFLRRFRAEARLAAGLRHPNIVQVYDWGDDDGLAFVVLEHMAGGSLRDLLDAGHRLSPAQAALIGRQAANGLTHAHGRGLAHRDIKPANLLFHDDGRLGIADFGVARALAEATWTEPAGVILGTARYASPEQAQGGSTDDRTDVYSLALVLYEAVTGRVPFAGDTTVATLMARLGRRVEPDPALGPLADLVSAATAPDPAERPGAGWLAAELDAAAQRLPAPERLPLVPPAGGTGPAVDDDVTLIGSVAHTEIGARTAPRPAPAAPPAPVPPPAPEPAAVSAAPPGPAPGAEGAAASGPRRGRRAALIAAVLVGLGLAAWLVLGVFRVATPSHKVPRLIGLSATSAEAALRADHFHYRFGPAQHDDAVPAGSVSEQQPLPGGGLKEGSTVTLVLSEGPAPRPVPDLRGLDQYAAVQALAAKGFGASVQSAYDETVPSGQVVSWSPTGVQPKGTTVAVTVSQGPRPRTVPDVTGLSYADAAAQLTNLGLVPSRKDVFSNDVPKGQVASTDPPAGASAAKGSTVTVSVSKGPDLVTVPDVTNGMSVDQATAVLARAGLQVANVFGPPNKPVFYTNPPPGTKVPRGSSVDLYTKG